MTDQFIATLRTTSLRFRAKSGPAIDAAITLSEQFLAGNDPERRAIEAAVNEDVARKLNGVSGDLAERAINDRNTHLIAIAAVCQALASGKEDEREQIRRLVLVAKAADVLGVDYRPIFRTVAERSNALGAGVLERFSARDAAFNELTSFRVQLVKRDGQYLFEPIKDEWS